MDEITTPKQDFYLVLPSAEDMPTVLAHFYNDEGELLTASRDYAIDVVGQLSAPTGNMLTDDDGNEYPETAPIAGHHINLRLRRNIPNKDADDPEAEDTLRGIVEALDAAYGVTPNSPSRVWL
jgi:hypothetical protein